jgi:histone-arginine methyltransferase CARM1
LAFEARHKVDFTSCTLEQLQVGHTFIWQNIHFNFSFNIMKVGLIHGIGCWFDAYFCGSQQLVVLSTSPASQTTHWYQTRLLFPTPLGVNPGQTIVGNMSLKANKEQSMDVRLTLSIPELHVTY